METYYEGHKTVTKELFLMLEGVLKPKGRFIFRKGLLGPNLLRMFFLFLSNPFSPRAFLSLESNP